MNKWTSHLTPPIESPWMWSQDFSSPPFHNTFSSFPSSFPCHLCFTSPCATHKHARLEFQLDNFPVLDPSKSRRGADSANGTSRDGDLGTVFLTLDKVEEPAEQRKLKFESPVHHLQVCCCHGLRGGMCVGAETSYSQSQLASWAGGKADTVDTTHWNTAPSDPATGPRRGKGTSWIRPRGAWIRGPHSWLCICSYRLSRISTGGAWESACLKSSQLLLRPTHGDQQAKKATNGPSNPWLWDHETSRQVRHAPGEF